MVGLAFGKANGRKDQKRRFMLHIAYIGYRDLRIGSTAAWVNSVKNEFAAHIQHLFARVPQHFRRIGAPGGSMTQPLSLTW